MSHSRAMFLGTTVTVMLSTKKSVQPRGYTISTRLKEVTELKVIVPIGIVSEL